MPTKTTVTDEVSLKALQIIEILRELDQEVPGQVMAAFLFVASHNPTSKKTLEDRLGLTSSSSSRVLYLLSDDARHKQGYGLIERLIDPENNRRLLVSLTDKGEYFRNRIRDVLLGD